ncbi:MAG: YgjV family protein [Clostridia bacterium]|nr:YgjV family protein [Clostridia bacterium]
MHPIIPQVVGILAVAAFLFSYQLKKKRDIIICNTVSRCLYIIQYLLLGAISGAVLDVLGVFASVLAERSRTGFISRHKAAAVTLTNTVIVAIGLLLYESPYSLLPIAGVLLHTGAFWLSSERAVRRLSLLGSPFWLVYNIHSRAYGSAIGDILTMLSIIIAMIKYRGQYESYRKTE